MKKITSLLLLIILVITVSACSSVDNGEPAKEDVYETVLFDGSLSTYTKEKPYEGVFYTVHVNAFADSDGDGVGDIPGLIRKLDYLNDGKGGGLGVTGIWVLPIYPANTMHNYDIKDYYNVDSRYGTLEDFDRLVDECSKRGIAVILDLILNCTSNKHPWFLDALNNPESPYREYYHFYNDKENKEDYNLNAKWNNYNGWSRYDKEGNPFSISSGEEAGEPAVSLYAGYMPDLNYDNESTWNEIKNIAKFWLDRGLAGFRLDSAPHIYSDAETPKDTDYDALNHKFWTKFYDYCKTINPDTYLVGEVLTSSVDTRGYYMKSLKSDFDYSLIYDIQNELKYPSRTNTLANKTKSNYDYYREVTNDNYINAPFLTDADINRLAGNLDNDPAKIKLAHIVSYTLEGLPFMYYGDEIGMLGNKSSGEIFKLSFPWGEDDPLETKNRPYKNIYNKKTDKSDYMQPVKEQVADAFSIYGTDRRIIALRTSTEALCAGRFEFFSVAYELISYKMVSDSQEAVIIHNFFNTGKTFNFSPYKDYKVCFMTNNTSLTLRNGNAVLEPYESIVLLKNKSY